MKPIVRTSIATAVAGLVCAALLVIPPQQSNAQELNGFASSQVSPRPGLDWAGLQAIFNLNEPGQPYYTAAGLNIGGMSADAIKIVQTDLSQATYIGVFHHVQSNGVYFNTYLASIIPGENWSLIGQISSNCSMPQIAILPDDSVLFAEECNPNNRPFIVVNYYQTISGFVANPSETPTYTISLPWTANACADGTPEFDWIQYNGDITQSSIEISQHYFSDCINDQEAIGTLTNFSSWSSSPDAELNYAMAQLGYPELGGREAFESDGVIYEVLEANSTYPANMNWADWRVFLVNRSTMQIVQLAPNFPGGAYSPGKPTASFMTLPDGTPAIAITYYIYYPGNANTPAGPYVYIYPLMCPLLGVICPG